ncbi:hypothetical protein Gpo141_00002817 [Globisporangium polare]
MLYSPAPVTSRSPFFRVSDASSTTHNKSSKNNKKSNTKQTGRFSDSTSSASSNGSMLNCCDADAFFADDVRSAEEELLSSLARSAMRHVLSAATSSTFANGDWRERKHRVHEAVYEQRTASEFSIIARAMVPCTIDEISSVLSSDNSDQLNATLIELLGDQFGYAINARSIPTARSASLHSDLSVKFLSFGRRGRSLLPRASPSSSAASSLFIANANGQRNVTILDYVEADRELRTACRVVQTLRRTEDLASAEDPQSILGDAFCGYVLREDPVTKHTVVFFYGSHMLLKTENKNKNKTSKQHKLSQSTISALRKMTRVTSKWVAIARRRRLGAQRIILHDSSVQLLSASSSSVRLLSSCCFTCDQQFRPLVRKKHLCCLCGYFICGRCSSAEDVEQRIGLVQRLRVCGACLSSVNRKAFDTSSSKRGNNQHLCC